VAPEGNYRLYRPLRRCGTRELSLFESIEISYLIVSLENLNCRVPVPCCDAVPQRSYMYLQCLLTQCIAVV